MEDPELNIPAEEENGSPLAENIPTEFDDATPNYVEQQPDQMEVSQVPTPGGSVPIPNLKDLVTKQDQAGLAPGAPAIPGTKKPNPFDAKKLGTKSKKATGLANAAGDVGKGDVAGLALDGAKGKLGDGKVGKAADRGIDAAKEIIDILSIFEGNILAAFSIGKKYIKKFWKPLLIISLFMLLPEIAIGVAISASFASHGDKPLGVAVGTGTQYPGSSCAEMSPSIDTTYKGENAHLFVSGTSGIFSEEATIDPSSGALQESGGTKVAFWDNLPAADKTAAVLPWFVTARWPYTGWGWKGGSSSAGFGDLPPPAAFAGKKIIIFNPSNGKAVIGIAMESGPAPYTGVLSSDASAQQALWEGPGSKGGYRVNDPVGFRGRVAGGTKTMEDALGTNNINGIIEFGFAPDSWNSASDTHQPGPFACTIVTHSTTTAVGSAAVPGVKEGKGGQCGTASAVAVVLHYNTTYSDSIYDPTTQTVKKGVCVGIVNYVNTHSGVTDFVDASLSNTKNQITFNQVIASVQHGDPVIMYTSPDAIYSGGTPDQHIFVITGYNTSNQTFDVMSPKEDGFDLISGTLKNGQLLTADYLTSKTVNNASAYPGRMFVIRKTWTVGTQ